MSSDASTIRHNLLLDNSVRYIVRDTLESIVVRVSYAASDEANNTDDISSLSNTTEKTTSNREAPIPPSTTEPQREPAAVRALNFVPVSPNISQCTSSVT